MNWFYPFLYISTMTVCCNFSHRQLCYSPKKSPCLLYNCQNICVVLVKLYIFFLKFNELLTYTTEKTLFCFCLSLHIKYTLPRTACKALYLLPAYNFNLISFCNIYWDASSKLLLLSWTSLTASHHLTFSEADPSGWNTALALIYSFLVQDTVLDLPPPWYLLTVIFQNKH